MIHNKYQYNQGIGKYKVLSSTAGVGAIVPTTWGGFIMPLSIDNWPMIRLFTDRRYKYPSDSLERIADDTKCVLINDRRFVEYLKKIQRLQNFEALIAVPHLIIDEYNYCDYQSHPLFKKWAKDNQKKQNETDVEYVSRFIAEDDTLTIPSIVFPRWFRSGLGSRELMPIEKWDDKWKADIQEFKIQQAKLDHKVKDSYTQFIEPVECKKTDDKKTIKAKKRTEKDGTDSYYPDTNPLEQVQMVLICPNGHISDIPWDNYFAFKLAAKKAGRRLSGEDYRDLFNVNADTCINGQAHKLQWLPSRNNPDSYGTLKCSNPGCGESVSLEGIMNIRPRCQGEKPWVGNPQSNQHAKENCDQTMRWALVTSNSVYYAESFNSLYIPNELLGIQLSSQLNDVLDKLVEKQEKWRNNNQNNSDFFEGYLFPTILKDEVEDILRKEVPDGMVKNITNVFKQIAQEDSLDGESGIIYRSLKRGYGVGIGSNAVKIICIKKIDASLSNNDAELVLQTFEQGPQEEMTPEKYRFDEFKVFMENQFYRDPEDKYLCFNDIDLSLMDSTISRYFSKIKQFSNLAVSTTQLQFTRASNEDSDDEQQGNDAVNQMIFDRNRDEVLALPANQNFGEGLFFALKEDMVREFCDRNEIVDRYGNIVHRGLGQNLKAQMDQYGAAKFYLLHTFSHIIMKELEFTCGYPTASLQERLYYSDRMCGVLIYTADGSEGSMGGLVAQGFPTTIEKIIKKAIERAVDCSSDPLCWEHTNDQLNFAACFSCCMVSETSCEYFNMGLDRRDLVDKDFGYFKDLV
jgi:hypothetical protein